MNLDTVGLWLGRLVTAGFAALVIAELLRYFRTALFEPIELRPQAAKRVPFGKLLWQALLAFIASRLLVTAACAATYAFQNRTLAGFFQSFLWKLTPWDADHYLGIIERWYVAEGDARLHIVFLPFYPALCRALHLATGLSPFLSAEVVSNLALVGCAVAVFRLVEMDDGADVARRAMLLALFTPMTYFYSIPYTESVFLLMTLLAVLLARRRRFAWAVAFGAMAANARVVGMAVAIPIFWELLRADREKYPWEPPARRASICTLKGLPGSLGLLLYLWGNYRLHGDALQFLTFQREHWSQNFGTLANTFRYCLVNALTYEDRLYRLGVWIPQAALLPAVPAVLFWRRKREPVADTAYLLVFFYISFAPTWLLSGPRYLSAAYAVYPLLARIPKARKGFIALLAGECALLVYMAIIGLWFGKAY